MLAHCRGSPGGHAWFHLVQNGAGGELVKMAWSQVLYDFFAKKVESKISRRLRNLGRLPHRGLHLHRLSPVMMPA